MQDAYCSARISLDKVRTVDARFSVEKLKAEAKDFASCCDIGHKSWLAFCVRKAATVSSK